MKSEPESFWRLLLIVALLAYWPMQTPLAQKGGGAARETLKLDAASLYARSVTRHLRPADGALILEQGALFEDDGPAAGFSYKGNEETLSAGMWIRKDLVVDRPQARKATLFVGGERLRLQVTVNGKKQDTGRGTPVAGHGMAYEVAPQALVSGKNEIILSGEGTVWIARADEFALGSDTRKIHPNRSARSVDEGKTWKYDNLGTGGTIDGEYCVRLWLDHSRPQGSLTTPVLDAGNLLGKPVAPPVTAVGPVRVAVQAEGDKVAVRARSGSTGVLNADAWSSWQDLGSTGGTIESPRGRYLQVAVELAAADPLKTPRLKEIVVTSAPARSSDWTPTLKVLEHRNEAIVRTSLPFEYEPFDHPKLKALREKYKLDAVVQGARGDLELLMKLATWASRQFEVHGMKEYYPAWDALDILSPPAGKPRGGFCQQYNLCLLQAGESFGFPGRNVSIGGHEVVEFWSNEYRKWIHVDGDCRTLWSLLEPSTNVPLSLWELRDAQVEAMNEKKPERPLKKIGKPTSSKPWAWEGLAKGKPDYRSFRLVPRSNFLEKPHPIPLNQGKRGWFWTGYGVWDDARFRAPVLYANRLTKREDVQWTLNQARFVLEATEKPGEIRVHLETETPGFDTFLADVDRKGRKPVGETFVWNLNKGENRLEVLPRNKAGRDGIPSVIAVQY